MWGFDCLFGLEWRMLGYSNLIVGEEDVSVYLVMFRVLWVFWGKVWFFRFFLGGFVRIFRL